MVSRVLVDPERTIGHLDRNVFGGFIEHLGRVIYGGIYEEGSPLSDARGFRQDTLELLKELKMGVLRWPGGNFVSNYHWRDGVGPKDERPVRSELAWGGVESNRFGTDEFMAYCTELGTEPYVCLNMGSGDLEEALAWVEYCNDVRRTRNADDRRANGHDEPYGVKWWGLGNEMWGNWQVGALSAEEYVAEATRWARAIKLVDPEAKLVSCGRDGWGPWDRTVIEGMVGLVDLHSLHIYTGSDDYWSDVLQVHQVERGISTAKALIQRAAYVQGLENYPRLAWDEWNVWFRTDDGTLEERYNLADALGVGTYLNIFIRNADWVKMANLAQMVNAIAPIVTTPDAAAVQPIYYPFLFHAQCALDLAVDTYVDGPTVAGPSGADNRWEHRLDGLGPFTLVDAAATVDEARGRVAVTVVNRSEEPEEVRVVIRDRYFGSPASIRTVSAGSDTTGASSVPGVEVVEVEEGTESASGSVLVLRLPARSFSAIEAALAIP